MGSTLLGTAWPGYFNKPIAEEVTENAKLIGLPKWSDNDQTLAKAVQHEMKVPEKGLATKLNELKTPNDPEKFTAAGRMISATSRGSCRRSCFVIRRIFPTYPDTTGRMGSAWQRRLPIKATSRGRRCRR